MQNVNVSQHARKPVAPDRLAAYLEGQTSITQAVRELQCDMIAEWLGDESRSRHAHARIVALDLMLDRLLDNLERQASLAGVEESKPVQRIQDKVRGMQWENPGDRFMNAIRAWIHDR